MTCNICQSTRRIRLPTYGEQEVLESPVGALSATEQGWEEFDCPKCCMVPFKRVRAMKVITNYDPKTFGKFQMPIERGLAARFGEYLLREGLIRFTQKGSIDMGPKDDRIAVTAHLGVVSPRDTRKTGAVPEIAGTKPPDMSRFTPQEKKRWRIAADADVVKWDPPGEDALTTADAREDFDEPKARGRFSGIDL